MPSMDWFTLTPAWPPRYQAVCDADGVTLLDDAGLLRFAQPTVRRVAQLIARAQPLAAVCAEPDWLAHLPAVLGALAQMADEGWICSAQQLPGGWLTPDFQSPRHWQRLSATLEVAVLSQALDRQALLDWAGALRPAQPLRLVLCDDYFDPRLPALDAECRAAGLGWLPVRLSGEALWWGPYFDHQPGRPCWQCLDARLARNQPVRAYWRSLPAGLHHGVPLPVQADAVRARLVSLAQHLTRPLAGLSLHSLHADGALHGHPSPQRPQCPACGDRNWLAARQQQPLRLAPTPKLVGVAGGARTQASHATVARLLAEVSPLTGVVADLRALSSAGDMPVYHSQFFRPWRPQGMGLASVVAQSCLGKGASDAQSRASALCEAVERYAAAWQGDEAMRVAREAELPALAIRPDALSFFSAAQRASARPGERAAQCRYDPRAPLAWTPAWSLSDDAPRYLPLAACYADAPAPWADTANWSSNGCASGNCREEAILQGLLEVIERDAVAIWWYNRIPRPRAQCANAALRQLATALGGDWSCWLLDLSHDLGIPVLAAIGWHAASARWALGFGASLSAELAAERALTELAQLIAADKCLAADAIGPDAGFLWPEGAQMPQDAAQHADIADDIRLCVAAWRAVGHEVIVHDYSRPDIALATVKVVVPGACHIWPERANPRLLAVPPALGWRSEALTEEALNPCDLYV